MVVADQDDIPGSGNLSREQDELKQKCKALKLSRNAEAMKGLDELQEKEESIDSQHKEVDQYDISFTLAAQITRLNVSLPVGDKHLKKASEEVVKACRMFEADRTNLQQKQDDHINALKGLKEEVAAARQRSQESLQRAVEVVCRV